MSVDRPFLKRGFKDLVRGLLEELGDGSGGRSALTDTTEGSVVRTLVEAFSRELAVAYEQLEMVYKAGFLDTAEGVALDNLVALLGVQRRPAGYLEGLVVFSRGSPAPDDIAIPPGTPVSGRAGVQPPPVFETTTASTLRRGDTEVAVPVRAVERGGDRLGAGAISLMPRPIWGIEGVTNRTDLARRQEPETDDDLRARARSTLDRAGRATVAAIRESVAALGFRDVQVLEPSIGRVRVLIGDPVTDVAADRARIEQEVYDVIAEVRPVGILVDVAFAAQVEVSLTAELMLDRRRPGPEVDALRARLQTGLGAYFTGLKASEPIRLSKVKNLLTGDDAVKNLLTPDAALLLLDGKPATFQDGEYAMPAGSRARLLPANLKLDLVPPDPVVNLKLVLATGSAAATDQDRGDWASALTERLGPKGLARELVFADVATVTGRTIERIVATHDKTGRVTTLVTGQREALDPGEVIVIRTVETASADG